MGRRRAENDPSVRTELSKRQREVLALIADGATNGEIADRLGLSLEGAKWHVREIFSRLGVDSREEAAAWWKANGRGLRPFAWSPVALVAGGGVACVAGVLFAIAVVANFNGDAPAMGSDSAPSATTAPQPIASPTAEPTPSTRVTPVALRPQPELRETAAGLSWRVLVADDGKPMPPIEEAILAIGYDQQPARVDVLDADGRIAMRVETGYQPMAQLNEPAGTLVISDVVDLSPDDKFHSRLLVFSLADAELVANITLPAERLNFTTHGFATEISPDGRWAYWIEHAQFAPRCPDGERTCDRTIVHAVDLIAQAPTELTGRTTRDCGVPSLAPFSDSAVIVQCRTGGTRWVVDATAPAGEFMVTAPASAPRATWEWRGGRVGNLVLGLSNDSYGSLTQWQLHDAVSGSARASAPLADAWGAFLLNASEILVLRSNGRLERIDAFTGMGVQLPYSIDPGNQGSDIILTR